MKGWKTITFNVLTLVLLVLQQNEFIDVVPQAVANAIPITITIINIGLRLITTGPVAVMQRTKPTGVE